MKYCLIFLMLFVFNKLNSQSALLYYMKGDTVEAKIQEWNITREYLTVRIKGKKMDVSSDSLVGFKIGSDEYLSLKLPYMDHHQFCVNVKSLEEFNIYGWKDIIAEQNFTQEPGSVTIQYEYVKRQRDNRSAVYKFDREGLSQIPLLNCPAIMEALLQKNDHYEDLKDLVDAYDRDCGVEMRNK